MSCGTGNPPPTELVCGDGRVGTYEPCDDGNHANGDGCSTVCSLEAGFVCTGSPSVCQRSQICGNGVVEADEACDDGNNAVGDGCSAFCYTENGYYCGPTSPSVCAKVHCGDAKIDSGEECDDGNLISGDGCDSNCLATRCGNAIATVGEGCDDGNLVEGDGCDSNCTVTACGNGIRAGSETCDDGNLRSGDGCDANCTLTVCGNGIVSSGEACDDGNIAAGDGCSALCKVELGFTCGGVPSRCAAGTCGNSIVEAPEACDDGNPNANDGCEPDCTLAPLILANFNTAVSPDAFGGEVSVSVDSQEACYSPVGGAGTTASLATQNQGSTNTSSYLSFNYGVVANPGCTYAYAIARFSLSEDASRRNVSGFKRVSFWLRGTGGGTNEILSVRLVGKVESGCLSTAYGIHRSNEMYHTLKRPMQWTRVSLDLSTFVDVYSRCPFIAGGALSDVGQLNLTITSPGESRSLQIDDMVFE